MEPVVTANRGETLSGKRSGRWLIGPQARTEGYLIYYRCTCTCENATVKEVNRNALLNGSSQSCGCLRAELSGSRLTTHGMYSAPERRVHASMMTRCTNPKYHEYHLYGGRGITVCPEWLGNFAKFYEDMGPRPSPEHQLDRRDNSLGYSKSNCYWATKNENARNKRTTIMVEYKGESKSLAEWAELHGLDYHAVFYRYQKGDTGETLFRPSLANPAAYKLYPNQP